MGLSGGGGVKLCLINFQQQTQLRPTEKTFFFRGKHTNVCADKLKQSDATVSSGKREAIVKATAHYKSLVARPMIVVYIVYADDFVCFCSGGAICYYYSTEIDTENSAKVNTDLCCMNHAQKCDM